jgi:hypothetical protein
VNTWLEEPLETPAAWYGQDLANRDDWIVTLDSAQTDELLSASKAIETEGKSWKDAMRVDYPVPAWSDLVARLRSQLEGGLGFSLIRSLPVDGVSTDLARLMLWGIGQHVGYPEPQDAAGNLLHDVRDTGKDLKTDNIRAYQTHLPINYHNDGADAFMLLCYRTARSGGRSKLVSAVSVFNEILGRRPDIARVLQEPFDFDARGQERPGAPAYQRVPIFNFHDGHLNVLYKREYIDLAQRFSDVPELTSLQVEALDLMDQVCEELSLEFVMEPGDVIVANNYDLLHGRSAFQDGPAETEGRHMLRLWLSLPNGRSLPPIFEHTREFHYSYARRKAAFGLERS